MTTEVVMSACMEIEGCSGWRLRAVRRPPIHNPRFDTAHPHSACSSVCEGGATVFTARDCPLVQRWLALDWWRHWCGLGVTHIHGQDEGPRRVVLGSQTRNGGTRVDGRAWLRVCQRHRSGGRHAEPERCSTRRPSFHSPRRGWKPGRLALQAHPGTRGCRRVCPVSNRGTKPWPCP